MDTNKVILDLSRETSDKIGDDFFQAMAVSLTKELACTYSLISAVNVELREATTLAFCINGKLQPNMTYSMVDTPCDDLVKGRVCIHGDNVQAAYPNDDDLKQMRVKSFVGIRVSSPNNDTVGLLEIMDTKPMTDLQLKESILHVFGPRVNAEMERMSINRALKESEDRYRSLFEAANDAYLLIDSDTLCIEYCNKKAVEIFSVEAKSLLLKKSIRHFFGMAAGNNPLPHSLQDSGLQITDKVQSVVTRLTDDTDHNKDVEVTSSTVMLDTKKHMMLVIRDLSETQKLLRTLRRSRKELHRLAYHDPLTYLPNRTSLQQKLESIGELDPAEKLDTYLMILDLDNFKEINDSLGHHVGDLLLKEIAENMLASLPNEDASIYRLGGDEFAVIIENSSQVNAEHAVKDLTEAVSRPCNIDNVCLNVSCSVGIANICQGISSTYELMRAADIAMYQAKSSSTASFVFYNAEMDIYSRQRLQIISDLKPALNNGEFVAYYQAKVDLKTMDIVGFEALARWQHTELGMISPLTFIAIAEASNDIKTLTHIILDCACNSLKQWHKLEYDISIAVNISAKVLLDSHLVKDIDKLLQQYNLEPHRLILEITESVLMKDPDRALMIAGQITDLGVRLSVDDFGTGYSSLAYLKRFPVDSLKIDREFVKDMITDPQDRVIVRSVIGLAENLNLNVVAEGIEDEETANMLKSMGCHQAQGFYYSKPMPADHVPGWLQKWYAQKPIETGEYR